MLFGSVSFVMIIFYMVNWPDDDIRRYAWTIISSTIGIFTSVLMFSAVRDCIFENMDRLVESTVESAMGGAVHGTRLSHVIVSWVLFFLLYGSLQVTIAVITGAIGDGEKVDLTSKTWVVADTVRHDYGQPVAKEVIPDASRHQHQHKAVARLNDREVFIKRIPQEREKRIQNMKCFATLFAEMTGFAAISAGATWQHLEGFSESPLRTLVPIGCTFVVMMALFAAAAKFRHHLSRLDDMHDERDELYEEEVSVCEEEIAGLALSFLSVQVLRYAFTGDLPPIHGLDTWSDVHWSSSILMYLVGAASAGGSVGAVALAGKLPKEHVNAHKALNIAKNTLAMMFGWCSLWATRWAFMQLDFLFDIKAQPGTIPGRLLITLLLTIFAVVLVFALDFLRDTMGQVAVGEVVECMVLALSILVGFSWESSFELAHEAVGQLTPVPTTLNLFLAFAVSLVILPGWRTYILVKVLAHSDAHRETLIEANLMEPSRSGEDAGGGDVGEALAGGGDTMEDTPERVVQNAIRMEDPRLEFSTSQIGVVAFTRTSETDPSEVNELCGARLLSNFFEVPDTEAFYIEPPDAQLVGGPKTAEFSCVEAAFLALQHWKQAEEFRLIGGDEARQRAADLGRGDENFTGFTNAWMAMLAVLTAKFEPGHRCADVLRATGDTYLLDFDDASRVDGRRGSFGLIGPNLLGLQLMLIRDWISGHNAWTSFLESMVDLHTGVPTKSHGETRWRQTVNDACALVNGELRQRR